MALSSFNADLLARDQGDQAVDKAFNRAQGGSQQVLGALLEASNKAERDRQQDRQDSKFEQQKVNDAARNDVNERMQKINEAREDRAKHLNSISVIELALQGARLKLKAAKSPAEKKAIQATINDMEEDQAKAQTEADKVKKASDKAEKQVLAGDEDFAGAGPTATGDVQRRAGSGTAAGLDLAAESRAELAQSTSFVPENTGAEDQAEAMREQARSFAEIDAEAEAQAESDRDFAQLDAEALATKPVHQGISERLIQAREARGGVPAAVDMQGILGAAPGVAGPTSKPERDSDRIQLQGAIATVEQDARAQGPELRLPQDKFTGTSLEERLGGAAEVRRRSLEPSVITSEPLSTPIVGGQTDPVTEVPDVNVQELGAPEFFGPGAEDRADLQRRGMRFLDSGDSDARRSDVVDERKAVTAITSEALTHPTMAYLKQQPDLQKHLERVGDAGVMGLIARYEGAEGLKQMAEEDRLRNIGRADRSEDREEEKLREAIRAQKSSELLDQSKDRLDWSKYLSETQRKVGLDQLARDKFNARLRGTGDSKEVKLANKERLREFRTATSLHQRLMAKAAAMRKQALGMSDATAAKANKEAAEFERRATATPILRYVSQANAKGAFSALDINDGIAAIKAAGLARTEQEARHIYMQNLSSRAKKKGDRPTRSAYSPDIPDDILRKHNEIELTTVTEAEDVDPVLQDFKRRANKGPKEAKEMQEYLRLVREEADQLEIEPGLREQFIAHKVAIILRKLDEAPVR